MRPLRSDRKSTRARRAIAYLFSELAHHPDDSKRILEHVRAYSVRHRVPLLASERALFCPSCSTLYPPHAKRRVRAQSLFIHCGRCGALRRLRARTTPTRHRNARNAVPKR